MTRIPRDKPIVPTEAKVLVSSNASSPPVVPSSYTNGHRSPPEKSLDETSTTVVENGRSDHDLNNEIDNDDGQWSDWEHDPVPPEPATEISQPLSIFPPTTR